MSADRSLLLAFYAATLAVLAKVERGSGLYRALCQVRAELERACDLPQSPTRRNGVLQ